MIRMKYILLMCVGVLLLFTACERANPLDCAKNTGAIITEPRTLEDNIKMIVLRDNVNLVLRQSNVQKVEIEGGKNLMSKVKTEMQGDTLIIKNNNSCNWVRNYEKEITAYIDVVALRQIEYRGSGDISTMNMIKGDTMRLDIWEGAGNVKLEMDVKYNATYFHIGTADVYISGKAGINFLSTESYGLLDARDLVSKFSYITSKSSNNAYVYASVNLGAYLYSIGNVYYYGKPEKITVEESGTGSLIVGEE